MRNYIHVYQRGIFKTTFEENHKIMSHIKHQSSGPCHTPTRVLLEIYFFKQYPRNTPAKIWWVEGRCYFDILLTTDDKRTRGDHTSSSSALLRWAKKSACGRKISQTQVNHNVTRISSQASDFLVAFKSATKNLILQAHVQENNSHYKIKRKYAFI